MNNLYIVSAIVIIYSFIYLFLAREGIKMFHKLGKRILFLYFLLSFMFVCLLVADFFP